ncbi:MAG: hypothetical protein WCG55_02640 [bacterium]
MTTITQWIKQKSVMLGVVASIAIVTLFSYATLNPRLTHAAAGMGGDLHGYAWSSTVGWMSMNCAEGSATGGTVCSTSNYKVTLDPATQIFSGYAWSSNVGWVSFNSSDVSFCGSQAALSAGRMTGWARVLSGVYPNGADGCISFGSATTSTYGVNVDSVAGTFSGYAWGSITLGWLDFSRVTMTPTTATVDLKVFDPSTGVATNGPLTVALASGTGTAKLSWTSSGVSSCTASVTPATTSSATDWHGSVATTSTGVTVGYSLASSATYTYTITCTPSGGTLSPVSDSVQVVVSGSSTGTYVDLKVQGVSGPTDGPITMPDWTGGPEVLLWTSSSDVTSCVADSSPRVSDWNSTTAIGTSSVSTAITLPSNMTTGMLTYVYKIVCSGSTIATDTVLINVPPADVPTCAVRPGPYTIGTGTHVHFEVPITIAWTPSFNPTDFSLDLSSASGLAVSLVDTATGAPATSITARGGRLGLWIDGAMPTSTKTIVVNASPSSAGTGVTSCDSASIVINPSGSGGVRGTFPWQEK